MDHWVVHLQLEKQSAYGMYLLCHIKTIMNFDIITNIDPGAGGLKLPPDVNVFLWPVLMTYRLLCTQTIQLSQWLCDL